MARRRKNTKLNFIVSCLVGVGALVFFSRSLTSNTTVAPEQTPAAQEGQQQAAPAENTTPSSGPGSQQGSQQGNVPPQPAAMQQAASGVSLRGQGTVENPPPGLPEDLRRSLQSPPPELPEDLKAQLNAPPPELPEDLRRQLEAPPPELPADLKAQLEAPPPELPEDIKRALAIPPRTVSIEEVNTPPDPGL